MAYYGNRFAGSAGQRGRYPTPNDRQKRYRYRDNSPDNWGSLDDIQGQFGQFGRDFYNENWFDTPDVTEWYGQNKEPRGYGGTAADQYRRQTTGPSKYAGEDWQRQFEEHMANKPKVGGTFWGRGFDYQPTSAKWDFLHDATKSSIGGLKPIPTKSFEELVEQRRKREVASSGKKGGVTQGESGPRISYDTTASRLLADIVGGMPGQGGPGMWNRNIHIPSGPASPVPPEAGGGGAVPDTLNRPAPPYAEDMVLDIASTMPQLGNQYRNIANEGMYGAEGMQQILSPLERSRDMILQRLDPYTRMMLELYDKQTQKAQEGVAVTGAGQRRRATQAMGDTMARIGVNQPGRAAQLQTDMMTPFYQDQADRAFDVDMGRLGQEQGLRAESEGTYRDIVGQRGAGRAGLIQENLQSKMSGLQGLQGVEAMQGDLIGNQFWGLQDPMGKQYSYQSGLMGLGHGFDISKMGYQGQLNKDFSSHQVELQKSLETWMYNNNLGQYMDADAMQEFIAALTAAGSVVPG